MYLFPNNRYVLISNNTQHPEQSNPIYNLSWQHLIRHGKTFWNEVMFSISNHNKIPKTKNLVVSWQFVPNYMVV